MRNYILGIVLCLVIFNVNASVITFEDVITSSFQALGDDYHGFDWNNSGINIGAVNYNSYPSSYQHGTVSGVMSAFNYFGNSPVYIDLITGGTFDFNGAYMAGTVSPQYITFEGWNNGVQLYTSSSILLSYTATQWIELNWTGIDRLIINNCCTNWTMDDFTYEITSVPIPSAIWLFGSGLLGLIGIARRKKV